jgi:hypothetical protein
MDRLLDALDRALKCLGDRLYGPQVDERSKRRTKRIVAVLLVVFSFFCCFWPVLCLTWWPAALSFWPRSR